MNAALQLAGIRKSFDGALALDGASFESRSGEVHALLGENGAGKSSLMNVAAGLYAPDAGSISINGAPISLNGPASARSHGIGMVHQHFKLVRPFTVAENVLLANPQPHFASGLRDIRDAIKKQVDALKFSIDPNRRIDTMTVAEQQQAEIVKVLVGGAKILILDEPTAVLTDAEAIGLLEIVQRLARSGTAVVLVTHKLQDVKRYADVVTIMRGGKTVATLDPRHSTAEELTELTVGQTSALPERTPHQGGETRLNVGALTYTRGDGRTMLNNTSFYVRAGEIYGIAGVSGNGQAELAEALIGAIEPSTGEIWVDGAGDISHAGQAKRREAAIAAIPADRYAYALAGSLPIQDNLAVAQIRSGRYGSIVRLDRAAMRRDAIAAVKEYDVQGVRSVKQKASLLSGGNAQKLVIAREFSREPEVVVAHSPSRGLDARACAAVHQRLIAARERGAAIVLISEDLDEILSLSDRIGVMTRGAIVAEFERPADRQAIGRAMVDHA
ncbi:ABC transporter ATP-binding protein [Bradyrhizobium sp. BRP22]|uniref:ABC transporter ATP-binding protein n=1 Tax=Bradyrhizobium sp. BRP22 TaxID=2793821 RepID=UPI001CD6065A|nr:ABC transporter ATP-binding protein [Bradyrhizobium sp. BRP22]MCA1458679.1 ABC transporter ATP-binding protein [Bradyrhizobium sp. BRP22]